jgi:hypothetical protein
MRSLFLATILILSGCGGLNESGGTAMLPPQVGNYCEASVSGACLGCQITCSNNQLTSCKTGTSVASSGSVIAQCTRAARCECH